MRHGRGSDGGMEEANQDGLQMEAAIEAPLELAEVAGEVLGAAPAAGHLLHFVVLDHLADGTEPRHHVAQDF